MNMNFNVLKVMGNMVFSEWHACDNVVRNIIFFHKLKDGML
jgi:hypothetical protein